MKKKNVYNPKRNGSLFCALFSLLLSVLCCVFATLCLRGTLAEKWRSYALVVVLALSLFFAVFYAFTILSIVYKKQAAFRLMLSGYFLLLFAFFVWWILLKSGFFDAVGDSEKLQAYLKKSGGWMPVCYVLLQFLQVVVLPIPAFVSTAAGVALFGAFYATVYSFLGVLSASVVAFWIGRKLGYKAVSWAVGEETLEKWLKKVKGKDNLILTAMFILPLFPDDVLCFVAGLSSMSWKYFLTVVLLARAVGIAGTCYSVDLIPLDTWWGIALWIVIVLLVVISFVLLLKRADRLNEWFEKRREGKKQENSGKKN